MSGQKHPDVALWRLLKAGESGLNLSLFDLFGCKIRLPSLRSFLKTLVTGENFTAEIEAVPAYIIQKLLTVQEPVDRELSRKLKEAERLAHS